MISAKVQSIKNTSSMSSSAEEMEIMEIETSPAVAVSRLAIATNFVLYNGSIAIG